MAALMKFLKSVKTRISEGLEGEPLLSSVEFGSGSADETASPATATPRHVEVSAAGVTLKIEEPASSVHSVA